MIWHLCTWEAEVGRLNPTICTSARPAALSGILPQEVEAGGPGVKPSHVLATVSQWPCLLCMSIALHQSWLRRDGDQGLWLFSLSPTDFHVSQECFKASCWSEFGHHFIAVPLSLLAVKRGISIVPSEGNCTTTREGSSEFKKKKNKKPKTSVFF